MGTRGKQIFFETGFETRRPSDFDSSVHDKAGAVLSPFDPSILERQLHAGVEACHAVAYRSLITVIEGSKLADGRLSTPRPRCQPTI